MFCFLAKFSIVITTEKVKTLCRMNSALLNHKKVWEVLILRLFKEKKNHLKIVHFMKKKLDAEHSSYFFQVIIEKN